VAKCGKKVLFVVKIDCFAVLVFDEFLNVRTFMGITTLSITTLHIMTLSIMTLSITILSITALHIMALSIIMNQM